MPYTVSRIFGGVDRRVRTVEVFRLKEGEYELAEQLGFGEKLASPLFPGLSLPVSSLWEA